MPLPPVQPEDIPVKNQLVNILQSKISENINTAIQTAENPIEDTDPAIQTAENAVKGADSMIPLPPLPVPLTTGGKSKKYIPSFQLTNDIRTAATNLITSRLRPRH